MSERLLRPKEVCRLLGVSYVTLRRWIKEGKVRAVQTLGGKYRIPESEVKRLLSGVEVREIRAIIYARVSSSDQKSDLERQIQYLTRYCSAKGYKVIDVLSDIASGLKTNRRGLQKLFNYIVNKQVDVVVVTYKDRLTRFGFEYLEYFF
ncbi:MAG: IS607 family transposase, partial [Candidatus Methanomethylicota archaeon]